MTCSGVCECTPISSASNGIISDGPGSYENYANCRWLFTSNAEVNVQFTMIDVEEDYDSITVEKCTNAQCDQKVVLDFYSATFLSTSSVYSRVYTNDPANHPFLRIKMQSDDSITQAGFTANWWSSGIVSDTHIYIYINIHTYTYTHICTYIHTYTHICIHTYIYVNTYTYTCIYI